MPTIREAYLQGREHLAASGSVEAAIEAEVLLRHALRLDRAGLYMRWDQSMPGEAWDRYRRLLDDRATGRPVPYITGQREFMGLSFAVDERVMIPRPETEVLVEFVAKSLTERASGRGHRAPDQTDMDHGARSPKPGARLVIVDVGTGSGCIAVSLAHLLPRATVFATDVSAEALEVARANAVRHGVDGRITFLRGDLLNPLPPDLAGRVDGVVSNPPYVPLAQRDALAREIRDFEPQVAVFAEGGGTAVHRRLIAEAPRWLAPSGLLAMEVALGQADAVAGLMRLDGTYATVRILPDYSTIPRVVAGTLRRSRAVRRGSVEEQAN